ncbi:MAG TPA: SDR family NAD(P)-dependent oxidoreductase [Candidatus Kapabacteria bacterium]|nr:SDR family NAD(P)-dependent oxidoreductase [Candidatus Kapabacteria bacterium]HRI29909.1 SDR family NAD(P)-dependent oxidoreductase [Candidatus Kapabacteria bacterium]HRK59018.1 SDR family NAD(P)-dependent oxidoreductase [Candidatus Kapabacteria bacterium]
MSVTLHGKTVVITGASSGIGEATAYEFAKHGARLVLVARRAERLAEIAELCRKDHNVEVQCIEADVRNQAQITSLLHDNIGDNAVDVLVNNAGLSRGLDPVQTGDSINWEEMIDTNIKGLLWVTKALLPSMIARGTGMIINIASVAGRQAYPNGNVYCATKAAVRMLSETMQFDVNGTGVRVTNIDPGLVETEFSLVRFRGDEQRAATVYKGYTPLSASDVAETIVFCATRPAHVSIHDVLVMPTAQASTQVVHKVMT